MSDVVDLADRARALVTALDRFTQDADAARHFGIYPIVAHAQMLAVAATLTSMAEREAEWRRHRDSRLCKHCGHNEHSVRYRIDTGDGIMRPTGWCGAGVPDPKFQFCNCTNYEPAG